MTMLIHQVEVFATVSDKNIEQWFNQVQSETTRTLNECSQCISLSFYFTVSRV